MQSNNIFITNFCHWHGSCQDKTRVLQIQYSYLDNGSFYCSYNSKLCLNHMSFCSNNFKVNHCFFGLICLGGVDFNGWNRAILIFLILLFLSTTVFFLLSSLSGRLQLKNCWFQNSNLKLFFWRVFYWLALIFSYNNIG